MGNFFFNKASHLISVARINGSTPVGSSFARLLILSLYSLNSFKGIKRESVTGCGVNLYTESAPISKVIGSFVSISSFSLSWLEVEELQDKHKQKTNIQQDNKT